MLSEGDIHMFYLVITALIFTVGLCFYIANSLWDD